MALYAPSGAGKTSLLRCLVALDPLVGGQIFLDGEIVGPDDGVRLRRQVAYVAQSPRVSAPSVREYVLEPWRYAVRARQRAASAPWLPFFDRLDLPSRLLDASTDRLSGGERKRLALVRALSLAPRVLLLDEPGAGLDADRQRALWDLLDAFGSKGGAVLVATHQPISGYQPSRSLRLESGRLREISDGEA